MQKLPPPLEIVVISLPNAAERRASVERQMRSAGLPFRFFDALSGPEALAAGDFESIDEREYMLNCGRRSVPGEVGCFASHRRVWQQCASGSAPLLVMEDDFCLRANFRDAIRAAAVAIDDAGFVRLQTDLRARKFPVADIGEFTLAQFSKPPHGLMCYAISPPVARKFVAQTRVVDAPVDVFVKKYWDHGQALYALLPYSVGESQLADSTSIPGRRRRPKKLTVAMRRFCRKAGWELHRRLWHAATPGQTVAVETKLSRNDKAPVKMLE